MVTISAIRAAAGSWRTTSVGMVATYSAISRASSRSFLARAPRARANCRSRLGLMRRTDRPAASKARRTPRLAAARLEPNGGEEQSAQPPDQRAPACLVIGDREACALRQQQHVKPVLRHVDSTEALLYHPLVPSLLMRARALATVREWKKRLEHQAHSRPCRRGGYGLPVATGAVS